MYYTSIKVVRVERYTEKAMMVHFDFIDLWIPLQYLLEKHQYPIGTKNAHLEVPNFVLKNRGLKSHIRRKIWRD